MTVASDSVTSIFAACSCIQIAVERFFRMSDQPFGTTRGQVLSQWVKLSDMVEAANQSFICTQTQGLKNWSPLLSLGMR